MKVAAKKMLHLSLPQYTCMAIAFLSYQSVQSEVVYTHIDPDLILNDDDETTGIDMDLNGSMDFTFLKNIGTYETDWGSALKYFTALWCRPQIMENEIAGSYFTVGSAAYSSYLTFRPYALPENFDVDVMLSFQNDGYQLMAFRVFNEAGNLIRYGGHWWPEKTEEFIGVHFLDENDDYHYGWIRVTVADSAETLIIHDYAYERTPELGIITGDMDGTAIDDKTLSELININCDGKVINIFCQPSQNKGYTLFNLYDLSGKKLFTKTLINGANQIEPNFPTGTYLVICTLDGKVYTKKIILF